MRLIFRIRPFCFMFRKDWYSICRWGIGYEKEKLYLIDIGMITFGFARKKSGNSW